MLAAAVETAQDGFVQKEFIEVATELTTMRRSLRRLREKIEVQADILVKAIDDPAVSDGELMKIVDHLGELRGKLAQNATEAQRMTYAGRSDVALREANTFDDTRLEAMPLFAPAARQGRLL
jgi:hypothetical protein